MFEFNIRREIFTRLFLGNGLKCARSVGNMFALNIQLLKTLPKLPEADKVGRIQPPLSHGTATHSRDATSSNIYTYTYMYILFNN
jgi:hypothetical protein